MSGKKSQSHIIKWGTLIFSSLVLLIFISVRFASFKVTRQNLLTTPSVLAIESEMIPKSSRFQSVRIPSGFPSDFPLYVGDIIGAWGVTESNLNGYKVIIDSSESKEKVSTQYSQKLVENGWTVNYSKKTDILNIYKDSVSGYIKLTDSDITILLFQNKEHTTSYED